MPRDGDVNYGSYSNAELLEAVAGINAELFPENYGRLIEEMRTRNIAVHPMPAARTSASLLALLTILGTMIAIFAYGNWRFPDMPIEPCGDDSYCGKQMQPHTIDDYTAYLTWSRAMLLVWPPGMLAIFLLQRRRKSSSASP